MMFRHWLVYVGKMARPALEVKDSAVVSTPDQQPGDPGLINSLTLLFTQIQHTPYIH